MTPPTIDPPSESSPPTEAERHADKYNDPRAKITGKGVAIGLGVLILAMFGAAASIYGRRTRLEKTTQFWGDETIMALQLGERLEMLPLRGREFTTVDLSGTPGLGHLRRRLLDERSFDWESENDKSVLANVEASGASSDEEEFCIQLRISDPTARRFRAMRLDLDLTHGWVGHSGEPHSVKLDERKRTGLRHFLETIMNAEKQRYDMRDR